MGDVEQPRARPGQHGRAAAVEGGDGDGRRVRPEQAPAGPPSVRRWWASKAAANTASSGSDGASRAPPVTLSVSSAGHPAATQASASASSSSTVSRSSSAEAVTSDGPGQVGGAQVREVALLGARGDRRTVGRRARQAGRGDLQQLRVAVVQDPGLRPGQARGEPAAHRAAAAAQVAHHQRPAGRGGEVRADDLDQLGRSGGGVGGLAQRQPVRRAHRGTGGAQPRVPLEPFRSSPFEYPDHAS